MIRFIIPDDQMKTWKRTIADTCQVLNQNQFLTMFNRRKGDDFWKTIEVVQSLLKTTKGFGSHYVVDFSAKVDKDNPTSELHYDYASMGEDRDLIKSDPEAYCLKILTKMCYYVKMLYNYEILKLWGEFLIDDLGQVWFVYAFDIWVRVRFGYEEITNKDNITICWEIKTWQQDLDPVLAAKV